jgi:hypothetical protein
MPIYLSIALFILSFILGIFAGRHFKRIPKSFNPFDTIEDPLEVIKEQEKKFKTFSPSKKRQEESLEKQLNEDNI